MIEYEAKTIGEELFYGLFEGLNNTEDNYIISKLLHYPQNQIIMDKFKKIYGEINMEKINKIKIISRKNKVNAGEIWRVKRVIDRNIEPVGQYRYIYTVSAPENSFGVRTVLAFPISLDVQFATEKDFVVAKNNGMLGIPFYICTRILFRIPVIALEKKISDTPTIDRKKVIDLHFSKSNWDEISEEKSDYLEILEENFEDIRIFLVKKTKFNL